MLSCLPEGYHLETDLGKLPSYIQSKFYLSFGVWLTKSLLEQLADRFEKKFPPCCLISGLGETGPEQERSNGMEFSGYSDFPES